MPPQSSGGHASRPSVQTGCVIFRSSGSRFSRTMLCSQLIAKIIRVNSLGADPPQHAGETHHPFVFHRGHPHEPVFRIGSPEAPLANRKLVHMVVLPPHRGLQHVMQLRQSYVRGHQQAAPDRWARAEQCDVNPDVSSNFGSRTRAVRQAADNRGKQRRGAGWKKTVCGATRCDLSPCRISWPSPLIL